MQQQSEAYRRSFSFLDFAMLEASATQLFGEGLSCVSSPIQPQQIPIDMLPFAALLFPGASRPDSASLSQAPIQHTRITLRIANAPILVHVSP